MAESSQLLVWHLFLKLVLLVTTSFLGCSAGIGIITAKDLSKRGAKILMLCRSLEKTEPVKEEIKKETGGEVDIYELDLSSLESVRKCAAAIAEKESKIDILINNAGIMACPQWKTKDGFDMQFGTNHLGHFLLTELLLPLIKKSAEAKDFNTRYFVYFLQTKWQTFPPELNLQDRQRVQPRAHLGRWHELG